MSNRKASTRPALVSDRIALAIKARAHLQSSVSPAAVTVAGGPAVCHQSRRLLASYGVASWATWTHLQASGATVERSAGVEVASERQAASASAWGYVVFPMGEAAPVALEVKGEAATVAATVAKPAPAPVRKAAAKPAKPAKA